MRIDLEFVQLHEPLFINGTNFGLKLYSDPKRSKAPLKMYYDTEGTGEWTKEEHVVVEFSGTITIVENVAQKTVKLKETIIPHQHTQPSIVVTSVQAQVSGPGLGIRSAQIETPIDRVQNPAKRGRPAKFQGGEETSG